MKALIKRECVEINPSQWMDTCQNYQKIAIDLGTGEGEYAFRQSQKNTDTFFIGIDACHDVMMDYAAKAEKRAKKQQLNNLLYVVANAESLPDDLSGVADVITINLPWGSLRDGLVKGDSVLLSNLRKIAKTNATIHICMTYTNEIEEAMIAKRDLPLLTESYVKDTLKSLYRQHGIEIKKSQLLNNADLIQMDTKWAKKLGYGRKRETWFLSCITR